MINHIKIELPENLSKQLYQALKQFLKRTPNPFKEQNRLIERAEQCKKEYDEALEQLVKYRLVAQVNNYKKELDQIIDTHAGNHQDRMFKYQILNKLTE